MSVTVVAYRRLLPGQGDVAVARVRALHACIRRDIDQERAGALFQGRTDPDEMLYVASWPTREQFLTALASSPAADSIDQLTVDGPHRYFCRTLSLFERMEQRPAVVSCRLIECAQGTSTRVLAFMEETSGPLIKRQPGLALRQLCQDLDAPDRLFVVYSWTSEASQLAARTSVRPELDAALARLGARIERFDGRPRALWDRLQVATAPL